MKVVCIDNSWGNLTINRIYNMLDVYNDAGYIKCLVINDINQKSWYFKSMFKILEDVRQDRLNELI